MQKFHAGNDNTQHRSTRKTMSTDTSLVEFGAPTLRDRIRSQADDALAALTSARKQALKDYDADIREVRALQAQLRDRDESRAELGGAAAFSLSPKLVALLRSPLARYQ